MSRSSESTASFWSLVYGKHKSFKEERSNDRKRIQCVDNLLYYLTVVSTAILGIASGACHFMAIITLAFYPQDGAATHIVAAIYVYYAFFCILVIASFWIANFIARGLLAGVISLFDIEDHLAAIRSETDQAEQT